MNHYVPHQKGGGHNVFGADPVGIGVGVTVRVTLSYLMNRWVDFNEICMDVTLGHNEELIRFW